MTDSSTIITYKRISTLLFSVSILLGSLSLNYAELKIGTYGLVHSLPPTFFVALFLLAISFLITVRFNPERKAYLFLHMVALVVFLYLLPFLVEKTARFAPAYLLYGATEEVLQQGGLSSTGNVWQQWPMMTMLGGFTKEIAGLSATSLLAGFTIVFELISLTILYAILNSVTRNEKLVWIVLWLYFVAGWINRAYYSKQAYGFMIFLVIIFVILYLVLRKGEIQRTENKTVPIVLLILFVAIAAGHLLASVVAAVSLVLLYVVLRLYKVEGSNRLLVVIAILVTVVAIWLILPAGRTLFGRYLPEFRPGGWLEVLNFGAIFRSTFITPFAAGAEHTNIMIFRAIYTGVFCALAVAGFLHVLIRKKMRINHVVMLAMLLGACSIILIVGSYGGEIFYRALEFSLLFLAFFAARNLASRALSILLVVFLLVSPTVFVISAYANEKADYVSPAELRGVDFFFDHTRSNAPIHSLSPRIWKYPADRWVWKPLDLNSVCTTGGDNHYFLLGERDIETRIFLGGDLDLDTEGLRELFESSCSAKIYSSDGFALYK